MSGTKGELVTALQDYFSLVRTYNHAPAWQKDMMLRSTLLQQCAEAESVTVRHRLRQMWTLEAEKQGLATAELKSWV